MINASDRGEAMKLIDEAMSGGARQALACEELGVTARTVQRWRKSPADGRVGGVRPAPANKLSEEERQAVLAAANRPDCASLTPHQIVPKLADEGIYLASESTFYRILKAAALGQRRGRSKAPVARPLTTHMATGPNQVWCWDITWMPTTVRGQYFYWYMVKDIYSRKLIVNEVHETESSTHACTLLTRGCLREQTALKSVILHSDNGGVMKGSNLLATMLELNLEPSYSRPRVSNDNAYAEALFRTAKYCPMWPERPFDTLEQARAWVVRFVAWYNEEHRHSALKYVTPSQRHKGQDKALMVSRAKLYDEAKTRNPGRWARGVRNWTLPKVVFLNPERNPESEEIKAAA
jgi:transposase InsO family protein